MKPTLAELDAILTKHEAATSAQALALFLDVCKWRDAFAGTPVEDDAAPAVEGETETGYESGGPAGWVDVAPPLASGGAPAARPAVEPTPCPNCGGAGETMHDILVGGTEHDTEYRECEVCKGTGIAPPTPKTR